MGTWGTGISSNDTYEDVYIEFFELYNNGIAVKEISHHLIRTNKETTDDDEDCNNFWFALATAQWECKQLDPELLRRVEKIIQSGDDLETWKNLGASNSDLKKRALVLEKFLTKLKSEKKTARRRKRKKIKQPVFMKGDCLTFKLKNGNYGGAIVLEAVENDEYGHNLIAVTRIHQKHKPDQETFKTSEILVMNFANWDEVLAIRWYNPLKHNESKDLVEVCAQLKIQQNFDVDNTDFGFISDFKVWVIELVDDQLDYEKENAIPKLRKKVKEYINKDS